MVIIIFCYPTDLELALIDFLIYYLTHRQNYLNFISNFPLLRSVTIAIINY
jgi:hypothetical protein